MIRHARCLMMWALLLCATVTHAGTVTYVYTDPQGTPLAEADANGNITARFEYTPYGVSVPSMGAAPNGVGYTGHVNDPETGLVYMQARYYDAEVGRFLSVDPVGSRPGDLFNFNHYVYTNNNPVINIDPDGRETNPVSRSAYILDSQILNSKQNPQKGHFGYVRNGGSTRHTGNDIAGARGTPLVAPVSGTVVQSGYDGKNGGGNIVRIERNATTESGKKVFIHMSHLNSTPQVKVGDTVVEGETIIGELGNTGNAKNESPHVHLSVLVGGQGRDDAVDPQDWFEQHPPPKEEGVE